MSLDSYDKLLIQSNDTDGEVSFIDRSDSAHIITANGDVKHSTSSAKFGISSVYFDGTGDYLSLPSSVDFDFGGGDYTIELWFKPSGALAIWTCFLSRWLAGNRQFYFGTDGSNNLLFAYSTDGSNYTFLTSSTTPTVDVWQHLAVVCHAGTLTLYLDGTSIFTGTIPALYNSTLALQVGSYSGTNNFIGWFDEIRVSTGIARWTADFTPPTAPYLPFSSLILSSLEQPYSLLAAAVTTYVEQLYSITGSLITTLEQIYSLRMLASLLQSYGNSPVLVAKLLQYYGESVQLRKALEQLYDDALRITVSLDQPYHYPGALLKILEQRYSISANILQVVSEQLYSIRSVDKAMAVLEQQFSVIDGTGRLLSYDISVSCSGQEIGVTGINIEAGQNSFCITCDIILAAQPDYIRCTVLSDLTVTIDGEVFNFFIESRQRNRGHATAEYTISCLSKTALLDVPYADPIIDDLSGLASAIVTSLAAGYTVNWHTVDWYIPANTLMPADQSPLDVIRQIAAAAGAIIQTDPVGTINIVPTYPEFIPDWPTATVATSLSDAADFFATGEDFDHRPGYNRFLISDQLTSDNTLRLVEEQVSDSQKHIYAYQTPWADDFTLDHTGGDWVNIEPLGIDERLIEDELVEFISGAGNTSFPIYTRVSMEWLQSNLGTITFGEDGALMATIEGESLLRISYRTKCRKYLVTDRKSEPLQLVAEEEA